MGRTPEDAQVVRGLVDVLVLHMLAARDDYAFAMVKAAEAHLRLGPPLLRRKTLYPLLHRLHRRGFVTSYRSPGNRGTSRRYYRITRHGRAFLAARLDDWRRVARVLREILSTA